MKPSPWLFGGLGAAFLAGCFFLAAGLLLPGKLEIMGSAGGSQNQSMNEAKKKQEAILQMQQMLEEQSKEWTGLQGTEGEHRVFVSSTLVYLPKNAEPVQSLDRKMQTDDGMEIGWKMRFGFDPADPSVQHQDPDGDGFTNFEEFSAKTDPLRKEDSPAKESKLRSRSGDPVIMTVRFPEKSGGTLTLRFQVGSKRKEYKGKPGDSFWLMAGSDDLEVLTDETKLKTLRAKAKESGKNQHAIPIQIVSYREKVEKIKDAKAGGVEVEVDRSEVVLQRKDSLGEPETLVFGTAQRSPQLNWDVGDIRFYTPAGGGTEIGPFRMGESFSFEGKEFSIVAREGKKIELLIREESGRKTFWVPPEATQPSNSPQP